MTDNILVVIHAAFLLLFGVFLSVAFAGIKIRKKMLPLFLRSALQAVRFNPFYMCFFPKKQSGRCILLFRIFRFFFLSQSDTAERFRQRQFQSVPRICAVNRQNGSGFCQNSFLKVPQRNIPQEFLPLYSFSDLFFSGFRIILPKFLTRKKKQYIFSE